MISQYLIRHQSNIFECACQNCMCKETRQKIKVENSTLGSCPRPRPRQILQRINVIFFHFCSVYFLVKVIQHLVDVVEQTKVQGHYQVFCVLVKFG